MDHPWSSYPAFGGYVKPPEWLETHWLLPLFGKDKRVARKRYREFVEALQSQTIEDPAANIVGGVILGRANLMSWVRRTILSRHAGIKKGLPLRSLETGRITEGVLSVVCEKFGCGLEAILGEGEREKSCLVRGDLHEQGDDKGKRRCLGAQF